MVKCFRCSEKISVLDYPFALASKENSLESCIRICSLLPYCKLVVHGRIYFWGFVTFRRWQVRRWARLLRFRGWSLLWPFKGSVQELQTRRRGLWRPSLRLLSTRNSLPQDWRNKENDAARAWPRKGPGCLQLQSHLLQLRSMPSHWVLVKKLDVTTLFLMWLFCFWLLKLLSLNAAELIGYFSIETPFWLLYGAYVFSFLVFFC